MVNTHDIPESILMNVAGHLLMFQRDWSGPQPKQSSNKYRPVSFYYLIPQSMNDQDIL